jgi:hypothetical protein
MMAMKPRLGCAPQVLAGGQVLRVEYCLCCDVLSLHFGPMTLRLEPSATESAWNTLADALSALHRLRHGTELRSGRRQGLAS